MSPSRSSSQSGRSKKSNKQQSNHRDQKRSMSNQSDSRRKIQNNECNCLYIGNLDKRCPEDKLKDICQKFGPFEYCYIVFEPTSHYDRRDTKISRGYGFVKYKEQADAIKAKQGLFGMEIMSRKINVQVSKRNKPRQSTPGRYLGRKRSPPRRERQYRRRSFSHSSDSDYKKHRKYSGERERERKHRDRERDRDRDREREHKQSKRRQKDRDRSRSGDKKQRKKKQSRSNSIRK